MKKSAAFLFVPVVAFLLLFSFSPVMADGASLSASPSSGSYDQDDVFQVQILLNTGGQQSDGVDIFYLHYPADILQLQDADAQASGVQIQPGTLYPTTLSNLATTSGNDGKIDFSQISSGGGHYTGSGILATLTFKAIRNGTAGLTFDHTSGASVDCNVAVQGSDILSSATGASFTVAVASVQTPVAPTGGGSTGGGSTGGGSASVINSTSSNVSAGTTSTSAVSGQGQTPVSQMTISQLQAEISRIVALIAQLKNMLLASSGSDSLLSEIPASFSFNRNLKLGARVTDVFYLQIILNSDPETMIAPSGVGSPGKETNYFGIRTYGALIKFQQKYYQDILSKTSSKKATGITGPLTRVKLNQILEDSRN
ncbi:MAG: cohesin domain-containing protein [Candidatus Pacebacteria bacterium]|nr:cohesin domain-containing protein [Candidatus Paceibacterota bacterium]